MGCALCLSGDESLPQIQTATSIGELLPLKEGGRFRTPLSQRSEDPGSLDQSSDQCSRTGSAGKRAVPLAGARSAEPKGIWWHRYKQRTLEPKGDTTLSEVKVMCDSIDKLGDLDATTSFDLSRA